MSDSESPPAPVEMLRTVTPPYHGHPNAGMSVIGWIVFLGMLVILLPLLPFLILVWLLGKLFDLVAGRD